MTKGVCNTGVLSASAFALGFVALMASPNAALAQGATCATYVAGVVSNPAQGNAPVSGAVACGTFAGAGTATSTAVGANAFATSADTTSIGANSGPTLLGRVVI